MTGILNVDQVCEKVGVTKATLTSWYKFKELNPEAEIAQLLPQIQRVGPRKARFWDPKDVKKLQEFKKRLPKGCRGVMGSVTQKYVKRKMEEQ